MHSCIAGTSDITVDHALHPNKLDFEGHLRKGMDALLGPHDTYGQERPRTLYLRGPVFCRQ